MRASAVLLALSLSACDGPLSRARDPGGEQRGTLRATAVSAGSSRTCALRTDGEITCWGAYAYGSELDPPAGPFVDLAYDDTAGCGLTAEGALRCWGDLGPEDEPPAGVRFTRVSMRSDLRCGVDVAGALRCWGSRDTFAPGLSDARDYQDVAVGNGFACALHRGGEAECWTHSHGFEGFVAPSTLRFVSITSGEYHACGLTAEGAAHCWGQEDERMATEAPSFTFRALTAGSGFSCGIVLVDGRVVCWGERVGTRDGEQVHVPMESPSGAGYVALAAGAFHACAIDGAQRITCWGNSFYGNLRVP